MYYRMLKIALYKTYIEKTISPINSPVFINLTIAHYSKIMVKDCYIAKSAFYPHTINFLKLYP